MSVRPVHINVIDKYQKKNLKAEEYKKTENTKFGYQDKEEHESYESKSENTIMSSWKHMTLKTIRISKLLRKSSNETQIEAFQSSMKYCVVFGQFLGLFPIMNFEGNDERKMKWQILSWRYSLCIVNFVTNLIGLIYIFYWVTTNTFTVTRFSWFLFFVIICFTSVSFIRLSTKWHYLMKSIATSELNDYIDPYVVFKCNCAAIAMIIIIVVQCIVSEVFKCIKVYDCAPDNTNIYDKYHQLILTSLPWFFDLNVPFSVVIGVYLQITITISAFISSYSHVFIICVSLYLASILEVLNEKINSHEGRQLPASHWRALREDYNRATRLVRSFDDVINFIVFIAIGNDLFFVCCQVYFLLGQTIIIENIEVECPSNPNGLLNGYGYIAYIFTLIFLLIRSFAILLIAAKIHSTSVVPASILYNVPSASYNTEVQRFLEQIHGDTVALTGLNFFYVTKELILSMVGTIVTYELVLLQFRKEDPTESPE